MADNDSKAPQKTADDKQATVKPEVKVAPVVSTKAETLVKHLYVGPNVYKYGLFTNQVYSGNIARIEEMKSDYPLISQLFAPLDKISEYQAAVNTKGTPRYLAVQQLKEGK